MIDMMGVMREIHAKGFWRGVKLGFVTGMFVGVIVMTFISKAHAAEGSFEACAGYNCRKLSMEFYSVNQIKSMHPEHYCDVYLKAPPMIQGQLPLRHVLVLEKDCKRVYNMGDAMVYNFVNPKIGD